MQTYHFCEPSSVLGNSSNTYTTDCPAIGDIECTSQADTIGASCSHRTLRAWVLAQGSASCSTNRLASSHPTTHRPEMSLVGVSPNGSPSLTLTLDSPRIGRDVHDRASCADLTSVRSRDVLDWKGDGPGGRGRSEWVYKSFQSRSSYVMARNHLETWRTWVQVVPGVSGKVTCRSPPDDIRRM